MKDKLSQWIAWRLPKRVVLWAALRLGAYATTGNYSDTVIPELAFMDAIARYKKELQ